MGRYFIGQRERFKFMEQKICIKRNHDCDVVMKGYRTIMRTRLRIMNGDGYVQF